eukprot:Rmarinus@m.20909
MDFRKGLLGLLAILAVLQLSQGCGFTTHMLTPSRFRDWYENKEFPQYESYMTRHWDALQAGTPFPDYFYLCGDGDAAEDSHWTPFHAEMANYVRETYPQPWDQDTEKLVAFMFGMVSHYIADVHWHGLSRIPYGEGFIRTLGAMNYGCSGNLCGDAHDSADTGGEFVAAYQMDTSDIEVHSWYIPAKDLETIFSRVGHDVSEDAIMKCSIIFKLGAWAIAKFGHILYPLVKFTREGPWMTEEYLDYYVGGLDDMAVWTDDMQTRFTEWLEYGPPDSIPAFAEAGAEERGPNSDVFSPSSDFMKKLLDGLSGLTHLVCVKEDGRGYRLEMCDADDTSLHRKVIQAMLDALGISTEQALETLRDSGMDGFMLQGAGVTPGDVKPLYGKSRNVEEVTESEGTQTSEYFGRAVTHGDFDADGVPDVVVGSPGYSSKGLFQHGAVRVAMGGVEDSKLHLDVLLTVSEKRARFGAAVSSVDWNCDGIDDLAVGAPSYGWIPVETDQDWDLHYPGRVYIYYGHAGSGLSDEPDAWITGESDLIGFGAVLATGDLNGDTCTKDLLVGAPTATVSGGYQRGRIYGYESSTTHDRSETEANWIVTGAENFWHLGSDLSVVRTGSGVAKVLTGAPGARYNGMSSSGRVLVFEYGSDTPLLSLIGEMALSGLGKSVSASPSLVAFAASMQSDDKKFSAGRVWTMSTSELLSLSGDVLLSSAPVKATFIGDEVDAHAGYGALLVADADGDGSTDLMLPQAFADREAGEVYAWNDAEKLSGEITQLRWSSKWFIEGPSNHARFATSMDVVSAPGIHPYVIIGAPRTSVGGKSLCGSVTVVHFN